MVEPERLLTGTRIIKHRYVIYLIGLIVWFSQPVFLPSPPGGAYSNWPFFIGVILLLLNLISLVSGARKVVLPEAGDLDRYEDETNRVNLVQQYGSVIISAGALIGVIANSSTLSVSSAVKKQFLSYLAFSLVTSATALVPIWVSPKDWRPLSMLRHVKTVLLTYSVSWLALAVLILLTP